MGEFEDRMHGYSLDEAESKLQWSKPGGFFGERLFKAVYEAAQHYRSDKRETELLRGALSNLTENVHKLHDTSKFLEELEEVTIDGAPASWNDEVYELRSMIVRLNNLVENYGRDVNPDNWAD
jgi:hypothetical protein